MTIVTRFAPSPTGYLHLGGVRTALFNYLFAKHYEGKFLLRIEDTDDKRLVEASLNSIVNGLDWLGIKHDGEIVVQSEKRFRHHEVAEELIKNGDAYYCYCSQAELDAEREKIGPGYKYSGKCRNLKEKPEGVKPTVRLNSTKFEAIEFHDLIAGDMKCNRDNLDDFIILRSDRVPTYMFAVVVDDNDSGVTHVIRGNDHLVNTAKQLMVYKLMGWKEPEYAHLPLINSDDGKKMSKRKHAVDLLEYKNDGFVAPALVNYLMCLGWTPSKEILSLHEAIEEFGIGALHKSSACFDMKRLKHINNEYLKKMAENNPTHLMFLINENYHYRKYDYLPKFVFHAIEKSLTEIVKRADTLVEIVNQAFFYFDDWKEKSTEFDEIEKLNQSIFAKVDKNDFVNEIHSEFEKINDWEEQGIESAINNICAKFNNLKKAEVMKFLRGILTGTLNSFSIVKIILILGRERIVARLFGG